MENLSLSLQDLLGEDYIYAVCGAAAALRGEDPAPLLALAQQKVNFYPEDFARRQEALMELLGQSLAPGLRAHTGGAPTHSYAAAQNAGAAPLSGLGCFRVGEDGRLYFTAKSEHYHIPLGHAFPGYQLLENAKALGIPNATHNNTRGYITRLLERSLVAHAAGLAPESGEVDALLESRAPGVLNTVINLETGSLAVEAALKMMLQRFYAIDGKPAPYAGRTPVFVVMADNAGGITAGYHGTTVLAQTLRGLWPGFAEKAEACGLYKIVAAPIQDAAAFAELMETYNTPPYKTAGFCHEIIMMNYGGIRLEEAFLQEAYRLCRQHDTPVLCDEIQSCAWYEGLFLFRQYGLQPDFVSLGKGFPGGNYPASRILASAAYDSLSQFGALVTNGQEELASLSYLITIAYIQKNGARITQNGRAYHQKMQALAAKHPGVVTGVAGDAHMSALTFAGVEEAVQFCKRMNERYCVDISAQTYKPNCPPVALTKLPLITSESMMDELVSLFDEALTHTEKEQ